MTPDWTRDGLDEAPDCLGGADCDHVPACSPSSSASRTPLPQGSLAKARALMEGPDMDDGELAVRREWWLSHGIATGCEAVALYGDDGEMQCSQCLIDFRRFSANDLSAGIRNVAFLNKRTQSSGQRPSVPEGCEDKWWVPGACARGTKGCHVTHDAGQV